MVLARTDPEITRDDMNIVHKVVNEDDESLAELRALRELSTAREKLIELFGGNGLARLEKLEAEDTERRAASAKVIEGQVVHG